MEFHAGEIKGCRRQEGDDVRFVFGNRFGLCVRDRCASPLGDCDFVKHDGVPDYFSVVNIFEMIDMAVAGCDIL